MQFTYYVPLWGIVLVILIAIGITIYGYRKVSNSLRNLIRYTLIGIRLISIIILLCCLLAPIIIEKKDVTPIPHLSILVDTSLSMQLEDNLYGKTDTSRMNQVNEVLFSETSEILQTLQSDYKVQLYGFDSSLNRVTSTPEVFEPTGTLTDINSAIREIVKKLRGQPNTGIVLITDGAHNASKITVENIENLKTPVYPIGVGSPQPPKDILIQNIDVLPIAYTEHENVIRVTIGQNGYNSESVRVSLREIENNRLIDSSILTLDGTDPDQSFTLDGQGVLQGTRHEIELKFTPQVEGNFQYKVAIPTLEGELTNANNESTFALKVLKAKLNILYFEGRPRWEYAFLKRTLERDPNIVADFTVLSKNIRSDTLLQKNDGYYPDNPDTQIIRFPKTQDELLKYDVLILGDISQEHLNPTQQQAIVDFVEVQGKSVIFLPSFNALGMNGIRNTQIADIIPIRIPARGCSMQDGEFSIALTQSGDFHPMLQLTDTFERNSEVWQKLPALSRVFRGYQRTAGATTLINNQYGDPILIFQRVGLGKTLLFTAEGIWNWDFGTNVFKDTTYETLYSRLWAQMLRWMSQQTDENRIHLTTDASSYAQGETAQVNVRIYSQTVQTQGATEIKLMVTTPNGTVFPLKSRTTNTESQVYNLTEYTARLKVEEKGTYNIRAEGKTGNITLGDDEIEIFVRTQQIELESPQLNETFLKQIAEKTGGAYINIKDADQLSNKIQKIQNPIFIDTERDLWAHPLVLIAVVGLLGTEWFLRKRNGLV